MEGAGFPTIGFTSAWSITERVQPPRSVFVDAPLGHTTGPPGEPATQRQLLTDGLAAGWDITRSGSIVALPYRWSDDDWRSDALSWSRARQDAGSTGRADGEAPDDTRTERDAEPQYQTESDAAAAAATSWDDQCLVCIGIDPGA